MSSDFKRILEPLKNRIMNTLCRAVLRTISDTGGRQFAQVTLLKGETRNNVERLQDFGFSSVPPGGSQALILCFGGSRGHPVIIAADSPSLRKKDLKSGESAQYNAFGDYIYIKDDGSIVIKASQKVRIEADILEVTGDIIDNCDVNERSVRQMREIYDIHVHPENDSGGPTDVPNQKMGD